ncbi:MAG: aldehyde dehydrogenase [Terracidiphilus sp.]|jgi:lactaldehyde dehydrogenase/glycolaldehyde dehydrogenase
MSATTHTTAAIKHYKMLIDGEFAGSETMLPVTNPATEEVISEVPAATPEQVNEAVLAAERAQAEWAQLPAIRRAQYLREIAAAVRAKKSHLARVIVEEQGKILPLAEIEVDFSADYLDYMAEFARRYEGDIVQSDRPGENIFIFKAPIGVVAGILPWNFPFFLIVRKMAPALVTGNTIVIKPSGETPNNACEFAKIVAESSLPKGVFNLVTGKGSVAGMALAGHPRVGMVSLTGSVDAGSAVMRAAAPNITKVSLELGGKAPAIVMRDADLDLAVKAIRDSRIINTGQVCNCAERVYVHESIADEFATRMTEAMRKTVVGDPFTPGVEMGPLVSHAQLRSVDSAVRQAIKDGAQVTVGGQRGQCDDRERGYYYQPTVLADCRQEMDIMRQEIFGPVLPIATFYDLDEAISMANDCEYGLTSSIFTRSLDAAMRAANELKFGETYVNREHFEAMQGFHAGWRKSGIGGADGRHGLEEFLQTHVVYMNHNRDAK